MDCKLLTESEVKTLCDRARAILVEEWNVQPVKCSVTVYGDIHIVAVLCGGNGDVCYSNVVSSVSFLKPCVDKKCNVRQHIGCAIIPKKPLEGKQPTAPIAFYCELCRLHAEPQVPL
ncbi:hypothetical protein L1987_12554 [Smallanthus sonchifolius]|uniref:Uncharacterized protein n=1 Tax=Smallanthus sonchifolius TaxID=185202 RepID=A0ACB9JEG8_9ASTR|nr:hypothetical protein L1987_12554 [Smallanthus sonchifolius]